MQNDQVELLREIYRLSRLKLEGPCKFASQDVPVWLVPIGRNPEFVGRESIMEDLERRLEPRSDFVRKAVLCGLDGVG